MEENKTSIDRRGGEARLAGVDGHLVECIHYVRAEEEDYSPGFVSRARCRMPLATSANRGKMTRSDWRAMELTPERLRPKKCDDSTCWDVVY